MNNSALISIIIPTHNRLEELKHALKSVFSQTLFPSEIIVVDDASEDVVTIDIFYGAPESINCVLLRNEEPKGGNYTRNRGVALASSKYIAFLDDDDTWESNKLALQFEFMESKNLDLCYTGKQIITVNENRDVLSSRYTFSYPKYNNLKKSIMRLNFIGTTSSIMVRKSVFHDVNGFDNILPSLQDYDFYIRLIFAGSNIIGIDQPLVNYFIYQRKSAVSKSFQKHLAAIRFLLKKYRNNKYYLFFVSGVIKITLKKVIKGS